LNNIVLILELDIEEKFDYERIIVEIYKLKQLSYTEEDYCLNVFEKFVFNGCFVCDKICRLYNWYQSDIPSKIIKMLNAIENHHLGGYNLDFSVCDEEHKALICYDNFLEEKYQKNECSKCDKIAFLKKQRDIYIKGIEKRKTEIEILVYELEKLDERKEDLLIEAHKLRSINYFKNVFLNNEINLKSLEENFLCLVGSNNDLKYENQRLRDEVKIHKKKKQYYRK